MGEAIDKGEAVARARFLKAKVVIGGENLAAGFADPAPAELLQQHRMGRQVGLGVDECDSFEDRRLSVVHKGLDEFSGLVGCFGVKFEMELTEREEALDVLVNFGVLEARV